VSCALAASADRQGIISSYAHLDGELIPTSNEVAIVTSGSDFPVGSPSDVTFGEDLDSAPPQAPAAALSHNSGRPNQNSGDNPYVVHSKPWNAELLNVHAIQRVSAGLNDLLKEVNNKIPMYRHKALADYRDDGGVTHVVPPTPAPHPQAEETTAEEGIADEPVDVDDSFLEVAATRLTPLQRLKQKTREKRRQDAIQESIQLEMESDIVAQPVMGNSADKALDAELRSIVNDPQLKEWEDQAAWKQQRGEVNGMLSVSDQLLFALHGRYQDAER